MSAVEPEPAHLTEAARVGQAVVRVIHGQAAADAVAEAAERLRAAQTDLEQAILAYRAEGASMATIAAAAGYSPPGVLGILRRHGVA